MTILLDLDEVLADFVGGALRVHGWTRERLETVWRPGTWSIVEPMGLTPEAFWEPINAMGDAFWLGLQPLPWAIDVVRIVDSVVDNWYIITSPGHHVSGYTGKIRWLRRFFGMTFERFVITQHKTLLARAGTLLIDDREDTVKAFEAAGGQGLLFPSRHNTLYRWADDPAKYLSGVLRKMLREQSNGVQV